MFVEIPSSQVAVRQRVSDIYLSFDEAQITIACVRFIDEEKIAKKLDLFHFTNVAFNGERLKIYAGTYLDFVTHLLIKGHGKLLLDDHPVSVIDLSQRIIRRITLEDDHRSTNNMPFQHVPSRYNQQQNAAEKSSEINTNKQELTDRSQLLDVKTQLSNDYFLSLISRFETLYNRRFKVLSRHHHVMFFLVGSLENVRGFLRVQIVADFERGSFGICQLGEDPLFTRMIRSFKMEVSTTLPTETIIRNQLSASVILHCGDEHHFSQSYIEIVAPTSAFQIQSSEKSFIVEDNVHYVRSFSMDLLSQTPSAIFRTMRQWNHELQYRVSDTSLQVFGNLVHGLLTNFGLKTENYAIDLITLDDKRNVNHYMTTEAQLQIEQGENQNHVAPDYQNRQSYDPIRLYLLHETYSGLFAPNTILLAITDHEIDVGLLRTLLFKHRQLLGLDDDVREFVNLVQFIDTNDQQPEGLFFTKIESISMRFTDTEIELMNGIQFNFEMRAKKLFDASLFHRSFSPTIDQYRSMERLPSSSSQRKKTQTYLDPVHGTVAEQPLGPGSYRSTQTYLDCFLTQAIRSIDAQISMDNSEHLAALVHGALGGFFEINWPDSEGNPDQLSFKLRGAPDGSEVFTRTIALVNDNDFAQRRTALFQEAPQQNHRNVLVYRRGGANQFEVHFCSTAEL